MHGLPRPGPVVRGRRPRAVRRRALLGASGKGDFPRRGQHLPERRGVPPRRLAEEHGRASEVHGGRGVVAGADRRLVRGGGLPVAYLRRFEVEAAEGLDAAAHPHRGGCPERARVPGERRAAAEDEGDVHQRHRARRLVRAHLPRARHALHAVLEGRGPEKHYGLPRVEGLGLRREGAAGGVALPRVPEELRQDLRAPLQGGRRGRGRRRRVRRQHRHRLSVWHVRQAAPVWIWRGGQGCRRFAQGE
mmetsp:Transcript_2456/g.7405  ORF Transcript_2456/g.7405 Transcript_2456/m.7405 type:complete len:247 (-) Transcript_2456:575-1315(-)